MESDICISLANAWTAESGGGVAIGLHTDAPYRAFESSQSDGYHLQFETNGEISLWPADGTSPQQLSRSQWIPPAAGEWSEVELTSTSSELRIRLVQSIMVTLIPEELHVGYMNLLTLIPASYAVDFKRIRVERT